MQSWRQSSDGLSPLSQFAPQLSQFAPQSAAAVVHVAGVDSQESQQATAWSFRQNLLNRPPGSSAGFREAVERKMLPKIALEPKRAAVALTRSRFSDVPRAMANRSGSEPNSRLR